MGISLIVSACLSVSANHDYENYGKCDSEEIYLKCSISGNILFTPGNQDDGCPSAWVKEEAENPIIILYHSIFKI